MHTVFEPCDASTPDPLPCTSRRAGRRWHFDHKNTGRTGELVKQKVEGQDWCRGRSVLSCEVRKAADWGEVWGIGRRLTTQLQAMNIHKAWDLATFDKKTVRRQFNINVERTARELAGEYCMSLTEHVEPKQMIECTRSFSERVEDFHALRTAICTFVANASRKLLELRQYVSCIEVFIRTSPFDRSGMQ